MTVPPQVLLNVERFPWFDGPMDVRGADGRLETRVTWSDAVSMAMDGCVEGHANRSGRVVYLRRLAVRRDMLIVRRPAEEGRIEDMAGGCTCPATIPIGAYKQTLQTGYVYALCLLRSRGI